jgi:hypothetical protein
VGMRRRAPSPVSTTDTDRPDPRAADDEEVVLTSSRGVLAPVKRAWAPAWAAAVAIGVSLGAAACGGSARQGLPLERWLSYSRARRIATVNARAGYDGVYSGFNFNGYGKGAVLVSIPRGWKVTVRCINRSASLRHSCAIVRGSGAIAPAFPRASSPDPERGLAPGQAATFTFVASTSGVYRLASLVPEQERAGMWDVVEVKGSRNPSVQLLRR